MSLNNTKVMLVEDEVLIGLMLAKKLRSFGYEVGDVVTTGEEAVERVGTDQPEVVLMDVSLAGDMNGIEAARQIKAEHEIPIIIFSGYDEKSLQEQTQSFKPAAVLSKLGPVSDITAAIEKAVA